MRHVFRWIELSPLNEGRAILAIEWVPNGHLFAVGGADSQLRPLATVEMLECPWNTEETVNSKWQYVAPMNQARYAHGVAYFKGKIIAAGGFEQESVECFTLPTCELPQGQWVNIRPMSNANTLFGNLPFGENLLLVGKQTFVVPLDFYSLQTVIPRLRMSLLEGLARLHLPHPIAKSTIQCAALQLGGSRL